MRPTVSIDAVSAGVFLDGDVAVLSFLTNDVTSEQDANVVMTRDMLMSLHRSMSVALAAEAAQAAMLRGTSFRNRAAARKVRRLMTVAEQDPGILNRET